MTYALDPSQPLRNPKHEAFVHALVRGEPSVHAYITAGYRPHHANAARLRENEGVRARIAHLQRIITEKIVDVAAVTQADVLKELARLGFSTMKKFSRVTVEGDAYLDMSDLTDDDWAAVQEMTSEEYLEGRGEDARLVKRTKVKLHDKKTPLIQLGKHLGLFAEKQAKPGEVPNVPRAPDPDRLREMAARYAPHGLRAIEGGKSRSSNHREPK